MFSRTSNYIRQFIKVFHTGVNAISPNNRPKTFPFLFLLSFLLNSCTSYISLIDNAPEGLPLKQPQLQALSCSKNSSIASHSSDDNETLENIFSQLKLSLEEEMILAILQQMAVRPATTSPWARLQVGILTNGQWKFFDYYKAAQALPLWQGLYDLTKRLKLKSMDHYLKLAQKIFPNSMEIGSPFANYLETYHNQFSGEVNADAFFKAGQILKSGESLRSPKWTNLPKTLNTSEGLNPLLTPVFKSQSLEQADVKCNFDIDLYSKSVYLVRPDPGINYNIFARVKAKEAFVVMTSVELQEPEPVAGENTLLKQKPSMRPVPICLVEREKNHQLLMMSLKGRDPGQHIYHLLQYSMSSAANISDVEAYLAFPRHQFLYEPARMLYESSRGSTNNLESFLRMDFPIYHTPSLGEVWTFGKFTNNTRGLAIDERSDAVLKCSDQ